MCVVPHVGNENKLFFVTYNKLSASFCVCKLVASLPHIFMVHYLGTVAMAFIDLATS